MQIYTPIQPVRPQPSAVRRRFSRERRELSRNESNLRFDCKRHELHGRARIQIHKRLGTGKHVQRYERLFPDQLPFNQSVAVIERNSSSSSRRVGVNPYDLDKPSQCETVHNILDEHHLERCLGSVRNHRLHQQHFDQFHDQGTYESNKRFVLFADHPEFDWERHRNLEFGFQMEGWDHKQSIDERKRSRRVFMDFGRDEYVARWP